MNKIKVIDLLNMISKGEEVPKRIKIKDTEYWFNDENKQYIYVPNDEICGCDDIYSNTLILSYELSYDETLIDFLNTEVEILEEEKKIPEKLEILPDNEHYSNKVLYGKINEIIDYLKIVEIDRDSLESQV